jgi:Nucleoplasmin-like domain
VKRISLERQLPSLAFSSTKQQQSLFGRITINSHLHHFRFVLKTCLPSVPLPSMASRFRAATWLSMVTQSSSTPAYVHKTFETSLHSTLTLAAQYRITMAAIDPTALPQIDDPDVPPRATLKMIRLPVDDSDDEADDDYEDDDVETIRRRLGIADETNGGPGEKTKKAREEALKKALDKDLPNGVNGTNLDKGKAKASDDESEEDSESDDLDLDLDDSAPDLEEFVICTLDSKQVSRVYTRHEKNQSALSNLA